MNKNQKIYIAGHKGMVGSACWKDLKDNGYDNIVGRTSQELDLRNKVSVKKFLQDEKPDIVIDAAARVGGILANSENPYEFLIDNMMIQNNLISLCHELNIKKLIFLGSSCIYPKMANQPLKEDYLLTGALEETNQWYAIAKISGVKLIEALNTQYKRPYISLMPTNLYGPNDNFDLKSSHVVPALLRKFHDAKLNGAKTVEIWGSGQPLREFMHVSDLARAIRFSIENSLNYNLYNVGSGQEISIRELATLIKKIVGYHGEIILDKNKPDGTPRKLLDVTRLTEEGFKSEISLESGIQATYEWFLLNY